MKKNPTIRDLKVCGRIVAVISCLDKHDSIKVFQVVANQISLKDVWCSSLFEYMWYICSKSDMWARDHELYFLFVAHSNPKIFQNINLSEQKVEVEVAGEVDIFPHVASQDHPYLAAENGRCANYWHHVGMMLLNAFDGQHLAQRDVIKTLSFTSTINWCRLLSTSPGCLQ